MTAVLIGLAVFVAPSLLVVAARTFAAHRAPCDDTPPLSPTTKDNP